MVEVRCVACGKLFTIPSTKPEGRCPHCNHIRKLIWVQCIQCDTEFGVYNKCKAICINCGYIHDCGEVEVIDRKDE